MRTFYGLQVRFALEKPLAVIGVSYSGRRSRLLLWNTDTDEFEHGQWLKGGLEICDYSPNGRYLAYVAQTFHRVPPSYFAISRPPYFKALLFHPVFHLAPCDAYFPDDSSFEWMGLPLTKESWGGDSPFSRYREVPGNPLKRKAWKGDDPDLRVFKRDERRLGVQKAVARYGASASLLLESPQAGLGLFPAADPLLEESSFASWDSRVRLIVPQGLRLFAFSEEHPQGIELIDLSDEEFHYLAAPAWAGRW